MKHINTGSTIPEFENFFMMSDRGELFDIFPKTLEEVEREIAYYKKCTKPRWSRLFVVIRQDDNSFIEYATGVKHKLSITPKLKFR